MIKKIANIVVWLMIVAWFTIVMGFVSATNSEVLCRQLSVEVSDSAELRFVTSGYVRQIVEQSGIQIQGYPAAEVNTRTLEEQLEQNPYIRKAEVYTTVEGELSVKIEQRRPVVRMMPGGRQGFYIDEEGIFLPLSSNFSPMVLLVTGYLKVPDSVKKQGLNPEESETGKTSYIYEILDFARYIDSHPFWKDQIVQVHRNSKGEFEIIPRVGAHQILLGSLDDYETKLRNLKLLYDQGLQKYGWNSYSKINLKYSNQVICTKR